MSIAKQIGITKFPFKFEYKNDKGNRVIYYEDSYGYWEKREYDSQGNEIYYEDSNGYWTKKEYDSNGNRIYYENSNKTIRDNRPKASCEGKVVEIDGKKYKLVGYEVTPQLLHKES